MFPPTFLRRGAFLALLLAPAFAGAQGTLFPLIETGPRSERVNIVVFSEGYTAEQLDTRFRRDAAGLVEALLAREPYATYRNHFNAYAIAVASNESGADYPTDGIVKDTYFNAAYGTAGLERLLTINSQGASRVNALLTSLVPEYDMPLVLVNDPHYGGSGGSIAVASVEANASEVVIHEIGHSFAGLGDEYDYAGSTPRETPNTTQTTDRSLIRWRHWIDPLTPLPTPENDEWSAVTGLFEGAAYSKTGWYRPTLDSLMNNLGQPYREVNEEAVTLSALELLPRIGQASPAGAAVVSVDGKRLGFRVDALRPSGTEADPLTWYVDGQPVAGPVLKKRLIPRGSAWKYFASATAPAASWKTAAFSDNAWISGAAPLGFGDTGMATAVPGGPTNSRYPAIYFRRVFSVANPLSLTALRLELQRDDGAVVYLNGVEIYRSNMASGTVTRATLAAPGESDAAENYWFDHVFSPAGLLAGDNLLAVEVHQNSLTSSDLRFDFALSGDTPVQPPERFISHGAVWSYLDTGVFPGATWRSLNFNAAAWPTGASELGYGDGDEGKVIGFGGNTANRHTTSWFRKKFTVADPAAFTALDLRLRRDDGAAVYLNGTEIARSNLGTGSVTPTLLAVPAADDGKTWLTFTKGTDALRAGENVIAAEVHQSSPSSSDLSFDFELSGRRAPLNAPWVAAGAEWRYWDKGAPAAGWTAPGFNDLAWSFGRAEFGYGDEDETTVIGYGGNASNRHPAAYFRHTFTVPTIDPTRPLRLRLKFDDGAVVYLNGVEVARPNMGWGAITHTSPAGREAPNDGSVFSHFEISAASLRPGVNVLAAEVHQFSVTSDDLSFDLELSPGPDGAFTLDPAALSAGNHVVEARYDDPAGKVLQDPAEHTTATRQWLVNVTPPADTDGDTLPDAWENALLGGLAGTANDDSDGDGRTNAEELAAGTHPGQAASRFEVTAAVIQGDGRLKVSWSSVPGKFYQVETAADPSSAAWNALYERYAADEPAAFTEVDVPAPPSGQARAFYRVRVTGP